MRKVASLVFAVLLFAVIPGGMVSADDVVVDPGVWNGADNGVIWINRDIGYLIYPDTTNHTISWTKTIDRGQNWTSPVTIQSACDVGTYGVWYDRWTKRDIGTEIHITWHRNPDTGNDCGGDDIHYTSLDTASDVLSGTVSTSVSNYGTNCSTGGNPCEMTITKARGGNLYIHAQLTTSSFQQRFLVSENGGATWSTRSLGPSGSSFTGYIAPLNTDTDILIGDGVNVSQDIVAWDYTSQQFIFYDFSANNWLTGSSLTTGDTLCSTNAGFHKRCMTRAVNSTGTAISPTGTGAVFSGILSSPTGGSNCTANPCTFHVFKMDTAANTSEVTPVFTSRNQIISIGLGYDTANNVLYAAYADFNVDEIYYKTSEDGGSTWSVETRFDNTANAKLEVETTPTYFQSGAQFMPVWEEGTALVTELDNIIELAAPAATTDESDFENKLDRFRLGLNFKGDTGEIGFALGGAFLLGILGVMFGLPRIVLMSLELMWLAAMAMPPVEYLPAGIFLSGFLVVGMILVFLIIRTITGSRTNSEDF